MTGLLAVKPDGGGGVGDLNGPGGELGSVSTHGNEARVEAHRARSGVYEHVTRGSESALGDGMVLRLELESDGITFSSSDRARGVDGSGSPTDDDFMVDGGDNSRGGEGGNGGEGREEHLR